MYGCMLPKFDLFQIRICFEHFLLILLAHFSPFSFRSFRLFLCRLTHFFESGAKWGREEYIYEWKYSWHILHPPSPCSTTCHIRMSWHENQSEDISQWKRCWRRAFSNRFSPTTRDLVNRIPNCSTLVVVEVHIVWRFIIVDSPSFVFASLFLLVYLLCRLKLWINVHSQQQQPCTLKYIRTAQYGKHHFPSIEFSFYRRHSAHSHFHVVIDCAVFIHWQPHIREYNSSSTFRKWNLCAWHIEKRLFCDENSVEIVFVCVSEWMSWR